MSDSDTKPPSLLQEKPPSLLEAAKDAVEPLFSAMLAAHGLGTHAAGHCVLPTKESLAIVAREADNFNAKKDAAYAAIASLRAAIAHAESLPPSESEKVLVELEALHAKATPGEWYICPKPDSPTRPGADWPASIRRGKGGEEIARAESPYYDLKHLAENRANGDCIAALHNHFPLLLRLARLGMNSESERVLALREALKQIADYDQGDERDYTSLKKVFTIADDALAATADKGLNLKPE